MSPYFSLRRRNRNFRLLYIGQTISQLGDWFNTVAVYALPLDLLWLGALFFIPGILWLLILSRWKDSCVPPSRPDEVGSAGEELLEGHMG